MENKKDEVNVVIQKYDELIKNAMKAREREKLNTYKLVKARLLEYKTGDVDKNGKYPVLDEKSELQILNKMVKELQGDIEIRQVTNSHLDEVEEFTHQMNYIKDLLPKMASENEVNAVIDKYISDNGNYTQKEMGKVIGFVRSSFKAVDGGMVAKLVKSKMS